MRQPSTEPSDDELLDALYPRLRSYASRVADADVDPDDLVQDAVAATLARHRLVDLDHPEAYLRRCILNTSANHRRRAGRLRRALGRLGAGDDHRDHYPSDLALLDELSPTDRAVLEMGDIDGTPHAAIADELGLSPGAVRKRAMRARTRLRYVVAVSLTILLAVAAASWFGEERGLDVTDDGDGLVEPAPTDPELPGADWPSRYLIDGMGLVEVQPPLEAVAGEGLIGGDRITVVAHAVRPYDHPVFVITASNETRSLRTINDPGGVAADSDGIVDLAEGMAVEGSDHVVVAEWNEPDAVGTDAWSFRFEAAGWQVIEHGGGGEWAWIVRLAGRQGDRLEPVEIAGHAGVLVTSAVGGDRGVVWAEGDVAHRVVADAGAEGSTEDTSGLTSRIYAATDDEWAAAQPGSQWYSVEQVGVPLPVVLVVLAAFLVLVAVIVARNR